MNFQLEIFLKSRHYCIRNLQRFFGQVSNFSATFGKELIATLTEDQKVASFFQALSLELDGKEVCNAIGTLLGLKAE